MAACVWTSPDNRYVANHLPASGRGDRLFLDGEPMSELPARRSDAAQEQRDVGQAREGKPASLPVKLRNTGPCQGSSNSRISTARSPEPGLTRGRRWSRNWRECGRRRRPRSKVLTYRRPFRVDVPPTRLALVIWCLFVCLAGLPGHRRRSSSRIIEPCGHRPTGKEGIT